MEYDAIVVGSGAGGCSAAYRMVEAGMKVLLIERGPELPCDGSTLDAHKVLRLGAFRHREQWLDRRGKAFLPSEFPNLGGKTKWYGAALLRLPPEEFGGDLERRFLPWPIEIDYEELAPYHEEAETLLAVRSFPVEPELQKVLNALCGRVGAWSWRPLPLGLSADILNHEREAQRFDGFASALRLKCDAQVAFIERVTRSENLHVLTNTDVTALVPKSGTPSTVAGVVCNKQKTFHAPVIVLAAGALNSPRLLGAYLERIIPVPGMPPRDLVGRFYKCHVNSALIAFSPSRKVDLLRKTALLTHRAFPHSSVQSLGYMDGEILGTQLPRLTPYWAAEFAGTRAYGFWLTTEDGSHRDNRVVGCSGDPWHPCLDYDAGRTPGSVAEHGRLARTLRLELLKLGYVTVLKRMPIDATAHACGTLVTGRNPRESVVNADGRVHGFDNLYIADASVFARSGSVNPALTVYAWGLRVADRLAGRARADEPRALPATELS